MLKSTDLIKLGLIVLIVGGALASTLGLGHIGGWLFP
jgi:hypothetical protein